MIYRVTVEGSHILCDKIGKTYKSAEDDLKKRTYYNFVEINPGCTDEDAITVYKNVRHYNDQLSELDFTKTARLE